MAWRDRITKVAPGLIRPAEHRSIELATPRGQAMVRAASYSLYGTGFGIPAVVPSLDHPSMVPIDMESVIRRNPMGFAPVWRVSFRLGAIPIKVYEFSDNGAGGKQRKEAPDHPAYKLLRAPNPDMTRNHLISLTVMSMYAFDAVGWLKERANPLAPRTPDNPVIALWPIPGPVLKPIRGSQRMFREFQLTIPGQPVVPLPLADVCYFRLMPDLLDPVKGMGPGDPLGDILDFSSSGLNAMRNFFRTALLQRLWIDMHGQQLEGDMGERLRAEMEQAAANPYGVPIMEGGATIETAGDGPDTDLLVKSIELTKEVIRHTFGFPSDEDNLPHFYGEVIQPVADAIEQELERTLMPDFAGQAFPEFAFRELLAGSPSERAKWHQTKILSGQETPAEARRAENEREIPGSDILMVPLNLIPLDQAPADRNPRPRDTQGGLGGQEGKGTTADLRPLKAASSLEDPTVRAQLQTTPVTRWRTVRDRVLEGQANGLDRRFRSILKGERDELRSLQAPLGDIPARQPAQVTAFSIEDTAGIYARSDDAIAELLNQFLNQVADASMNAAYGMMLDPSEVPQHIGLDERGFGMIQARVQLITERFSDRRRETLNGMLTEAADQTWTMRQADDRIRKDWAGLEKHLAKVIGETETAWAFERGAALGWGTAGIPEFAIVREGHDCSTGVCSEMLARGRYAQSDVPTPLHPNCRCVIFPAVLQE